MAYAVSILVEILEQDQYHLNLDIKPRIQSFLEKVRSFRDFLLYPCLIPDHLELRIVDAAHKAEDAIEVHTIQYHDGGEEVSRLDLSLTEVVNEFESIKQEITETIIDAGLVSIMPINHSPPNVPALPKPDPRRRNDVALFEDDFQTLKSRLIGGPSKLQIIPVVGVPGIGLMKVVGSLPNLEQLKLQKSDFMGIDSGPTEPEWEPAEGEFPRLLSLDMVDLNLVHWKAHAAHFPKLRHLSIQNCYAMVEIPLDIAEIQTLEQIQVNKASPFALASAVQIKKKQDGHGNKLLQVHIDGKLC